MLLCGLNMDLQGRVKFLTGGMGAAAPEPATRCSLTRLLVTGKHRTEEQRLIW